MWCLAIIYDNNDHKLTAVVAERELVLLRTCVSNPGKTSPSYLIDEAHGKLVATLD